MAKTKEQKKEILKNLTDKIKRAKSIVFAKFDTLGVKDSQELRGKLKATGSEYYVAKKTLLDLALRDSSFKDIKAKNFEGKIAVVFGYEDEIAPARIMGDFKKEYEDKIDFIGGILENKFIPAKTVEDLSKLPSKQELYAKIVGSINAPVAGFVNVLAGNLRNLVYIFKAIEEKKA